MSDTPRTDAAAIRCACSTYVVPSEFARELERENAALRADKARLDWLLKDDVMRFGFVYHDRDSIDAAMKEVKP